jgi:hypothetical protein
MAKKERNPMRGRLELRVSLEELEAFKRDADDAGIKFSQYALMLLRKHSRHFQADLPAGVRDPLLDLSAAELDALEKKWK